MNRFEQLVLLLIVVAVVLLAFISSANAIPWDYPPVAPKPELHFKDLTPGTELAAAAEYVLERGIFFGEDDGTFNPWAAISRREMVVLAERLGWIYQPEWKYDTIHITRREFADRYTGWVNGWFRSPWESPYEKLRRGQFAILLYRHQGCPIGWRPMKLTGFGGMHPDAEIAWRLARYSIPGLRFYGGYARSGHVRYSDHYRHEAFDAGGSKRAMHQLRDWLRLNFHTLNVKYIIHDRRIIFSWGSHYYAGTNGHWDHVHASFWGG